MHKMNRKYLRYDQLEKEQNMGRLKVFLLMMLMLAGAGVNQAQWIRGGLTVGMNMTQVDGDEIYGFRKYGFHGGAIGTVPVKNDFLITLETLYSQKGANQPRRTQYYRQYRVELDYVEVPVLLQYNDRDIFTIGAGFAYGRLVNVKEWEKGVRTPTTLLGVNAAYDRADYLALIDLKFRIIQRMSMNVRYQYSMDKIRVAQFSDDFQQRSWDRNHYNNVLTFRIAYIFNEPLPPPKGQQGND
jgi:hypothetical protein